MASPTHARKVLRALVALIVVTGCAEPWAEDGDRHLLGGALDSRVGLWEQRRRIPLTGMVVSSGTWFVLHGPVDSHDPDSGTRPHFFNLHRVEATGALPGERLGALRRIVLDGVIASSDRESPRQLARAGFDGPARTESGDVARAAVDGGFVLVEPVSRPLADEGRVPTVAERDVELLRRHDLAGVITSEDGAIVDGDFDDEPEEGSSPVERSARALADRLVTSLTHPDLFTFVRADSVDFDAREGARSVLAVAGARFTAEIRMPILTVRGIYRIDAADYLAGDLRGYLNHTFDTAYLFRIGRADRLSLQVAGRDWNDQRVTGSGAIDDFQATASGPYRNDTSNLGLSWRRARPGSRLRYDLGYVRGTTKVRFLQGDDFDQVTDDYSGGVAYRLNRRTTLMLEGRLRDFDYRQRADSSQTRLQIGVDARFSRRLSGRAASGYEWKDFDDGSGREGALSLDADLTWQQSRRSTLNIAAAREIVEVFELGTTVVAPNAFAIRNSASIGWAYDWTADWSTNSRLGYRKQDSRNSVAGS